MIPRSSTAKLLDIPETEEALLLRLRRGDEEAFRELVNCHHDSLIRIARTYVADWGVAEDVVQDTWLVVTYSLHRFEGRSSLRTWICGILAHKARDQGACERRHRTCSWAGPRAFPFRSWDDQTPEKLLTSRQAVVAMERAIDRLPANLKSVLILRDRDGVAADRVCAVLNINRANLYVRLHRARKRVKVAVETALGQG
jgi:RNA polymerase sigma-70 factor (ECF subfamily)